MADYRYFLDLTYGHLGRAIYDPANKSWCFSRVPGRNQILKSLGSYETPISASNVAPESSHEIGYSLRKLARTYPETVPALPLLPSLAHFSKTVTDATFIHDPTITTRLATGAARDLDNQRSGLRTIPLLAMVGGSAGDSVRLLRIEKLKLGWGTQESLNTIALSAPDFTGGEEGWWSGAGGQIKQVCFAQKQGRAGSWLAVRQLNSTTILRPLYHRVPVFPSRLSKDAKSHPASRINANDIVTLPMNRTGGSPHADVTFNPWYNRQFGIVDQEGHWSVWNIEGVKQKRSTYRASLEQRGLIKYNPEAGLKERAPTDGWGSICWVGNIYTFAASGRRDFGIFDLRHNPAHRLQVPDLGLSHISRWILDVKASPTNESHLFVVTTSQIYWLEVASAAESNEIKNEQSTCRILLSWRHSRYEEDTSLRLSLMSTNGDSADTTLLLYSRFTGLVTVFQFAMHPQQPTLPLSVSDPYSLEGFPITEQELFNKLEAAVYGGNPKISDLLMLPIHYITWSTIEPKGLGRLYQDHDVKFYTLLVLGNDLSLCSRLYTSGVPRDGWNDQERHKYELVKPPNVSSRRTNRPAKSTTWVTDERFVVEDEAVEEIDLEEGTPVFNLRTSRSPTVQEDPWTLNWEWLYKLAFLDTQEEKFGSFVDGRDMASMGDRQHTDDFKILRESLIAKRTAKFQPVETMLELHGKSFQTSDLVQFSSSFNSLMDSFNMQASQNENHRMDSSAFRLTFKSLLWPLFPGVSTELATSISTSSSLLKAIFNHLSRHWLTPIHDRVSEELYVANENVAKHVALSLYLASIGVQLHPRPDETLLAKQPEEGDTAVRLPLRLKEKEVSNSQRSRQEAFSSSAPSGVTWKPQMLNHLTLSASQPIPSRLPSTRPSLSRPASPPTPTEDPTCIRLRAYTTVKSQPPLSSRLSTILTEWTVGADPALYSWEASQRALNPVPSEDDHTQTNEQARRRKRDRIQKHHHQREPGKGQSGVPTLLSSQRDPDRGGERVRTRTSTAYIIPRMAFSSQIAPPNVMTEEAREVREMDSLPMTQVERGAFGGRHATHLEENKSRMKKRKREAGF